LLCCSARKSGAVQHRINGPSHFNPSFPTSIALAGI
jgi:hypothetical protein